jgi:hypothetical protein
MLPSLLSHLIFGGILGIAYGRLEQRSAARAGTRGEVALGSG